jgi:hypothetical protein
MPAALYADSLKYSDLDSTIMVPSHVLHVIRATIVCWVGEPGFSLEQFNFETRHNQPTNVHPNLYTEDKIRLSTVLLGTDAKCN